MVVVPSAARAARMSEAPARRSPISTSAPDEARRPVDGRVVRVGHLDVGTHPARPRRATRGGPRRSPRGRATCRSPASAGRRSVAGGRWRGPDTARSRCRTRGSRRRAGRSRRPRWCRVPHEMPTPTRPSVSTNAARCSHGAPSRVSAAAGHGRRDDERAGLDAVGDDAVLGTAQPLAALDLDRVGVGPLDRGAHLPAGTR